MSRSTTDHRLNGYVLSIVFVGQQLLKRTLEFLPKQALDGAVRTLRAVIAESRQSLGFVGIP